MLTNKEEFAQNVHKEIDKLQKTIAMYRGMANPVAPDDAIGRVSRMDAINNKSVTESALREAENRLKQLSRVLERMEDQDFGICQKCKTPIPEGRLLIRPESRFCVHCAR